MAKKARRSGETGEKRARRAMPRAASAAGMATVIGAIAATLTRPSVRARIRDTYEAARAWLKAKTEGPVERPAPATGPVSNGP